ncbi:MAG: dockerin type I repeat-containing protein [Candidatus Zixiibacteriota bacterium]
MKKILLTTALFILLSGLAQSVQFRIEAELYNEEGTDYIAANYSKYIKIYVTNDDRQMGDWCTPFKIYGTGGLSNINYSTPNSWIVSNEFKDIWNMLTDEATESWDGNLTTPDQYNFTGVASPFKGFWQPVGGEILAFSFYFDVMGSFICGQLIGNLCIDSGDFGNDTYDWIFDPPLSFNGPYCWPVKKCCCGSVDFVNGIEGPLTLDVGQDYSYQFILNNLLGSESFLELEMGPGQVNSGDWIWSWTPTLEDIGNHRVIVKGYGEGDPNLAIDRNFFEVEVLRPLCGDVQFDGQVNILDITYLITYLYKDGTKPEIIEVSDVNSSGDTNILDITYLINFLYKGGPDPSCPY